MSIRCSWPALQKNAAASSSASISSESRISPASRGIISPARRRAGKRRARLLRFDLRELVGLGPARNVVFEIGGQRYGCARERFRWHRGREKLARLRILEDRIERSEERRVGKECRCRGGTES